MMLHLFLAGPDFVRWELKALGPNHIGPFHLVIYHATGVLTEHIGELRQALRRLGELEEMLLVARTNGASDLHFGAAPDLEDIGHVMGFAALQRDVDSR